MTEADEMNALMRTHILNLIETKRQVRSHVREILLEFRGRSTSLSDMLQKVKRSMEDSAVTVLLEIEDLCKMIDVETSAEENEALRRLPSRTARAMVDAGLKSPKEDAPPLSDRAAELRKKAKQKLETALKMMNEQLKAGNLNEADTNSLTDSANSVAEIVKDWKKEEQDAKKRKASDALRGAGIALKELGGPSVDRAASTLRGLADIIESDSDMNKELTLSGLALAESLLEVVVEGQKDEE